MTEIVDREDLLTRFLLGGATEPERAEVEDRLLSDGEFYERLLTAEGDLMDSYVREALPTSEHIRFEESFLFSPRLRERVAFARGLAESTTRLHAEESGRPVPASAVSPNRRGWLTSLFTQRAKFNYAFAVGVLVVMVFAGWFVVKRMRAAVEQARIEEAVHQKQKAQQQQLNGGGVASIQPEKKAPSPESGKADPDVGQTPERQPLSKGQPTHSRPVFATITLAPGSLRDGTANGNLFIPGAASHLQLRLQLEEDSYQSYRVTISTPEGQTVWAGAARKDRERDAQSVTITLPANSIKPGDYIVELSGTITGGKSEPAAKYSFRVTQED